MIFAVKIADPGDTNIRIGRHKLAVVLLGVRVSLFVFASDDCCFGVDGILNVVGRIVVAL